MSVLFNMLILQNFMFDKHLILSNPIVTVIMYNVLTTESSKFEFYILAEIAMQRLDS